MSARTKPLKVVEPTVSNKLTSSLSFQSPPAKSACKMVDAEHPEEPPRRIRGVNFRDQSPDKAAIIQLSL